jgi:hypothetical protein
MKQSGDAERPKSTESAEARRVGSFEELLKLDPAQVESIKILPTNKFTRPRMTPQQVAELSGKIALDNLNRRIEKIRRGEKVREQ